MIKSSVTIALVPEIKQGPWIFWHDLKASIQKAADLKFDAVELFTSSAQAVDTSELKAYLAAQSMGISAVGTGAGKVIHGLTLTDPDPEIRQKAVQFIADMMRFGAQFEAPAIIGSMQGNAGLDRAVSLRDLADSLKELGALAISLGVDLIYEPLNRYETNLFNRLEDAAAFLEAEEIAGVGLLADFFHMNIEEEDLAASIRKNAPASCATGTESGTAVEVEAGSTLASSASSAFFDFFLSALFFGSLVGAVCAGGLITGSPISALMKAAIASKACESGVLSVFSAALGCSVAASSSL